MNQQQIEKDLDDDPTVTYDDKSSSSSHFSRKILDDEKSITNKSKMSEESEVKVKEIKPMKY